MFTRGAGTYWLSFADSLATRQDWVSRIMREHFRVQYFPIQLIFFGLLSRARRGRLLSIFTFPGSCLEHLGSNRKRSTVCFWLGPRHCGHVRQLGNHHVSRVCPPTFKDDPGERGWKVGSWPSVLWQVNLRHTVLFVSGLMAFGTVLRCGRKLTKLFFSEKINQTIFLFRYLNCCLQLPWKCHLHPFLLNRITHGCSQCELLFLLPSVPIWHFIDL